MERILLLDLLRALAILMVFIGHTVLSYGSPASLAPLQFGGTGVDLFFVLSGWLIGSQLFNELKKYGDIDVKRFWIRRWMRTLPAYYVVLLLTIIQLSLTKDNFSFPFNYFIFTQNYDYPLSFFTISWSLCVEEQFYLAIAPTIVFLTKIKSSYRTLILLGLLVLPSLFRELEWYTSTSETHVRWDCCIMGIILANLHYSNKKIWDKLTKRIGYIAFVTLTIYICFYLNRWYPETGLSDPSKLFLAFIFATWIIWANSKPTSYKLWGSPLILYISTRSYAIYLLHPEALAVVNRLFPNLSFSVYALLAFLLSCVLAEFLYKFIELPGMKARNKFKWARSRSHINQVTS